MGNKGLGKILKSLKIKYSVKKLKNKKIVIDASLLLYKFLTAICGSGNNLKNKKGKNVGHLIALFKIVNIIYNLNAKPIFVFDGEPPAIKKDELDKRSREKEKNKKLLKKLKNKFEKAESTKKKDKYKKEINKLKQRVFCLTDEIIEESKKLLDYLGVPWFQSSGEADPLCAYLVKEKHADIILSADYDNLTFGATLMTANIKSTESEMEVFDLDLILKKLKMKMKNFIELSILLGTDYCPGIRGIGPVAALKIIKEYGTISKFLRAREKDDKMLKKYVLPKDYKKKYKKAKKYFKNPGVDKVSISDNSWKKPDKKKLLKLLVEKNNFNEMLYSKNIDNLISAAKKVI